ncbi:MAG TPA: DUF397 domain-containing protein [Jiangellaceae bacterium]
MSERLLWAKSSFNGQQDISDCVEVASLADGGRAVRDSKNPRGDVLRFTAGEWAAFVKGVHAGEFD